MTAPNDSGFLSLGVSTTHSTAALALADTGSRTRRVLGALAAQGIASDDIQTQAVSVRRSVRRATKHRKRRVVYTASNTIGVTLRSVGKASAVIGAALKAGATRVSDIGFFPSNESDLYRQALGLSYDDARSKAELLAERAHVTLGAPVSIVEGQDQFEPFSQDLAAPTAGGSVPIESGTASISAVVTVVFAIS